MQLAHELIGHASAPSLVLVHGITENRHMWDPLLPSLAAEHYVLAVDLRGHGESDEGDAYDPISYASDVVETATALGIERPLLVGHSLGGVVVSAFAAIAPCAGVMNVDQPLRLADFQENLKMVQTSLEGTQADFEFALAMIFGMLNGPLPEDERDRLAALRGTPNRDVVLATWDAVLHATPEELDATVEALAGAITVPYLSLHGIDPGPGYAEWLTGLVPTATVEVWDELGHYPQLVEPDRFLARLAEFEAQVRG